MQRFVKAFKFKSLELFQNFVNFSKDFSRTFWPSILDLCKDLSRITNSIKVLSFIHFKIFRKPLGFQNCIHIRISKAIRLQNLDIFKDFFHGPLSLQIGSIKDHGIQTTKSIYIGLSPQGHQGFKHRTLQGFFEDVEICKDFFKDS